MKSEVFFFVSTISVAVITVLLVIALFYVVKVLKNLRVISDKVRERSEQVSRSMEIMNEELLDSGLRFFHLLTSFFSVLHGLIPEKKERIIRRIKIKRKKI